MTKGFSSCRAWLPLTVLAILAAAFCLPSPAFANPQDTEGGGRKLRKPVSTPAAPRRSGDRPKLRKPKTDRPFSRRSGADKKKLAEQMTTISELRKDLQNKDKELDTLSRRMKTMGETAGPGEMAAKMQALAEERDTLREQLKTQEETYQTEIDDLKAKLSAGTEGIDVNELIEERDRAVEENKALVEELDAGKVMRSQAEKQLLELSKEQATWNQKLEPLEQAKREAEEALADANKEKADAVKERDALGTEVKKLEGELDLAKKAEALAQERGKGVDELRAELTGEEGAVTQASEDAGKAKAAALMGLLAGLGALGLGAFLFFTIRHLKYEVAVAQAHAGGGIDPAEVEQIISARMSEIAGDMQTMAGGGDIEGVVGSSVKDAVATEMNSETFKTQVKQIVAQNAPTGGGGGGGMTGQEVKIMVDNQFRAITTYLKNEAVPKMVEDALRKK